MTISRLPLADSHAMRVERGLRALTDLISDPDIPRDVAKELAWAAAALHRCRSAAIVARMEREQGIESNGDNVA